LCYLLKGGGKLDMDSYYPSARVLRPNQIADWAGALSTITMEDLRKRYDPAAMDEADIYPPIWHYDSTLGYLLGHYDTLRSFLERAKNAYKGAIIIRW
jgi:hypothetical protein